MPRTDFVVRIAGENGQNVLSVGDVSAQAFARVGMEVYTYKNLPAEIKGGASMVQVRVSDEPVRSPGDAVDILMAWNRENYDIHLKDLRPGGVLLYDPDECAPDDAPSIHQYPIPLNEIAKQKVQEFRSKNVVAIGILASYTGLPLEAVAEMVRRRFGRRAELMEKNLFALRTGYEYAAESIPQNGYRAIPPDRILEGRLILTGNQAVALGTVASGCQYYAGYPITPATDIMEELAKHLPKFGGVVVQTEDEIAAITSCVGASFAGRKVMTATSGPGLSLMVEAIGLASMQELPMVIVNVQRGGPSTGLPTKPEQGDLDLALFGRHGDAPRIVLAPHHVEDCFTTTVQAFNLAEKYQTPVILLSDQHLAQRAEAIMRPDMARLEVIDRSMPGPDDYGHYERYRFTDDNVSPMAVPGLHPTPYVATGLEHDAHAHIDYSPDMHVLMSRKRDAKIGGAAEEPGFVSFYGARPEEAEMGLIAWGSTKGPVCEAIDRMAVKGVRVAGCFPKMLAPLPAEPVREFMQAVGKVAVVELNYSGQFARYLQGELCLPVMRLNKYMGLPFRAGEIEEYIEEYTRVPALR
ncbi:MAG: 2-oxoacid:acceptor oxidoreductase subunit alpha [Armatimonadetes bacterium]|nr:2-oxoacid:acceptor oxidoreductase subunit alpha [Armatimonadota bacterium]